MSGGNKIVRAAFVLMAASLLGRLIGFIREMVVAGAFGASMETDAFLVAFTIPSMVAMALGGAFNAVFIPVFSGYLARGEKEDARRMASSLINLAAIIFIVIIIAALLFAPALARLLAGGFSPEAIALTSRMMQVIFPGLLFIGLMGLAGGILNSYKHFLTPALGSVVTNIVVIVLIKLLAPEMGIMSYAIGYLVGYGAQFLVQLPVMARKGFRYRPVLDLQHPGVRRTIKLMAPVLAGVIVTQSVTLVERWLGSHLLSGSISQLNYAFRISQLPLALFGTAVTVAIFPALSDLAARKEYGELKETITRGLNIFALVMIPLAVGVAVLSVPVVRLLFEHGKFTSRDTVSTALALALYMLGLFPLAARDILNRGFYALQDTLTPNILTAVSVAANVALDIVLVRIMGAGGLALGAVLGALLNMILMYGLLARKLGGLVSKENLRTVGKVLLASVVMGLVTYFAGDWLGGAFDTGKNTGRVIQVGTAGLVGLITYIVLVGLLRVPELYLVAGKLRSFYRKKY